MARQRVGFSHEITSAVDLVCDSVLAHRVPKAIWVLQCSPAEFQCSPMDFDGCFNVLGRVSMQPNGLSWLLQCSPTEFQCDPMEFDGCFNAAPRRFNAAQWNVRAASMQPGGLTVHPVGLSWLLQCSPMDRWIVRWCSAALSSPLSQSRGPVQAIIRHLRAVLVTQLTSRNSASRCMKLSLRLQSWPRFGGSESWGKA